MPVVKIDYDSEKFDDERMQELCDALRSITAEATGDVLEDVSVYATKNQITAGAFPIEIYIQAGPRVFADESKMQEVLGSVKEKIQKYKTDHHIEILFNVHVVKMDWKFEFDI